MAGAVYCLTLIVCIIAGARSQVSNHSTSYDNDMHNRDSEVRTAWQEIAGNLKHISIGLAGVWGVNIHDLIYYRAGTRRNAASRGTAGWTHLSGGDLKQLDVGKNTVWGVTSRNEVFHRYGISDASPGGKAWAHVEGLRKHMSVSQKDHVWAVSPSSEIYHRIGATSCVPAGTSWRQIAGKLDQISVGSGGVWGVNVNNSPYYRVGTFGDPDSDPDGSTWQQVPGNYKYVSSADEVYAINTANAIYFRFGRSASRPTGDRWDHISGSLKQIESLSPLVWGVHQNGRIYVKNSD